MKRTLHINLYQSVARRLAACVLATLTTGAVADDAFSVRGGISGSWFDPDQQGLGMQIEVIDEHRALVAWFTYDLDGNPLWLWGIGELERDTISADLLRFSGGRFPPDFDDDAVTSQAWGELELTFADCNTGQMQWDPVDADYPAGNTEIRRLTGTDGNCCGEFDKFEQSVSFSLDAGSLDAGAGRWKTLFADFTEATPPGDKVAERRTLPEPLDDRQGMLLLGRNESDDLAMFMAHPVGGLAPETEYRVELEMRFATGVPQDCAGVGGQPGESVWVKLGAAGIEPETVVDGDRTELNIDKGNQSQGGEDAIVVGNLANRQENCPPPEETEWQLKTVSTRGEDFTARTDEAGRLWVYGGTDSGFESTSAYFVTRFDARFARIDDSENDRNGDSDEG